MTTKASLYFHINNGGVTISVEDKGQGPVISMKASHFGHQTGRVSVGIKRDALKRIAAMFSAAAEMQYSPESSVAAETPRDANAEFLRTLSASKVAGSINSTPGAIR